jgi:FixJ family two-component response regulator
MSLFEKPLVACATRRSELSSRVHEIVSRLGQDFVANDEVGYAIQKCQRRPAACIVVDHMLAGDSCDVVSRCSTPILVVVPNGNLRAAFLAGQVGALDMIYDDDPDDDVANCLQAAIDSVEDAKNLARFSDPVYHDVSVREKEILKCLLAGEPNKRVASILDIGLRTVEAGRANLMKKLCVNSFAELIRFVSEIENQKSADVRRVYESIKNKTAATRR